MSKLEKIFIDLVKITSPSGRERETLEYIEDYLKNIGWKTWQDQAGEVVGSECGNLYAYLDVDSKYETIVLCAHADTVIGEGEQVRVIKKGEYLKSDGMTILGADNRAGITALLGLASSLDQDKLKVNVLLFFPVHEEVGKMGSSLFEFNGKVKFVLNIDESMSVGNFVYASLSHLSFQIEIRGKSAHASKEYDKGISAIVAAAKAIEKLTLGIDEQEGWTMNIGAIKGGSKINVVPDLVKIRGEMRSYSKEVLEKKIAELKSVITSVEKETGASISIDYGWDDFVPSFEGNIGGELQDICTKACKQIGIKPTFMKAWSSSDANSLAYLKYDVVSVARGGEHPHAKSESIKMGELYKAHQLLEEILYLC